MVKTELNRSVWAAWAARQKPEERQSYEDWADDKIKRLVPLGRWQEQEDVAAMVVFLASKRAKNVTGQTINVDGGMVMHWELPRLPGGTAAGRWCPRPRSSLSGATPSRLFSVSPLPAPGGRILRDFA